MRPFILLLVCLMLAVCASGQPRTFAELRGLEGREFIDAANLLSYDLVVSNLDSSASVMSEALSYADEMGYVKGQAGCHAWMGIITYLQGQYDVSVRHNQQAIELYRKLGDRKREGGQYALLGFQMKARDLPRATALMRTGIAMLEAEGDSGSLTGAYDNFGALKMAAGERDSAIHYFNRALRLKRSFADSLGIPYSLNKLGTAYIGLGELQKARRMFDEAYRIRTLRNDRFGIMENLGFYGDWFQAAGRLDSAVYWHHRAIEEGIRQDYPFILRSSHKSLSEVYEALGDTRKALEMHRNYAAIKDTLLNEQRIRQVTELELRFETAERERENLQLRQQRAEQALALSRQRLWTVGIASVSGLLLLLGAMLFQRHRQREAAKRDAAIIAERDRGLRAIISATEQERGRIARDLHDGIVQTLTGVKLKLSNEVGDIPEPMRLLDGAISEVRDISHRMMPRALEQVGLAPALEDMLEKSLSAAGIDHSFEKMGVGQERFPEQVETGLYRIAQELVNNIIKHAKATHVSVQLVKTGGRLMLMMEDNGIGLPEKTVSNGLGLTGMRSRASGMGGEMTIERGPEGGTVAIVRIPVPTA